MKKAKFLALVLMLSGAAMLTSCIDQNEDAMSPILNTGGTDGQPPIDDNPPPPGD